MGCAELERRRPDIDATLLRDGGNPVPRRNLLRRRLPVIEGLASGEQARIVGAPDHDADAALRTGRKERVEPRVIQKTAPSGQEKYVRVRLVQGAQAWLDEVDAETPAPDDPLFPHLGQRDRRALHG